MTDRPGPGSSAGSVTAADPAPSDPALILRAPLLRDAAAIHQLIADSPPLDLNSEYLYLLLSEHFSQTCVIAQRGEQIDGFISAYFLPDRPDVLFVWQVAVHERARGRRLGQAMLDHLKQHLRGRSLRYLETTVSPGNRASRGLFAAMARRWGVPMQEQEFFDTALFADQAHEAEPLLRIGPLDSG
ncbi:diaminobutyrate acetyltransferase [Alcaligenes faecalis]|uniref:diaminobutyrate acetyltransferase n=1 Tax=Alcaligenes faecalis TaxID=511 RepID=UPI001C9B8EDD|nr:diaminobutyrate acetyltransferase [Alcaligenes faecalis]MBY6308952.1 diaminobutyrate acetyltransferase [Alcaligenes faecalis]MBY6316763.1 diaminobutyrate acetyltransferase [Alcaligenes faecalis]MBY6390030.1 diaminobutyrate acetyltransferase [Alcaligenes faecalis]